jgi:phytol kinase
MSDLVWLLASATILALALIGAVLARRIGIRATYVRDLVHIGAGIWVFSWPLWERASFPISLVAAVALVVALVPILATRVRSAALLEASLCDHDEHWRGLTFYTLAFVVLTVVGLLFAPFPAAAALVALSYGDGIGGAVGRRFGRHRYAVPGGKTKTVEGSVVVMLATAAAVALVAAYFRISVSLVLVMGLGLVASAAEALSPRGTDNLFVPAAVWAAAALLS